MSKTKITIICILTLLSILLLSLISNVHAENVGTSKFYHYHDSSETKESKIDELKDKNISGILMKNKGIYCIEKGQNLFTNDHWRYEVSDIKKITIKDDGSVTIGTETITDEVEINKWQGLAYILYQKESNDSRGTDKDNQNWAGYGNDQVQQALWGYLKLHDNYFNSKLDITAGRGGIKYPKTNEGKLELSVTHGGKTTKGGEASNIFNEARDIGKNGIKGFEYYSGDIYIITSECMLSSCKTCKPQTLLGANISKPTTTNPPKLTVNFKKVDEKGNNLSGAKISVAKVTGGNVEAITDNLKEEENGGNLGSVEVTLKKHTGEFKLKISETKVPNNYEGLSGAVTITFKYQKNGDSYKITEAIEDSNDIEFDVNTVTIKIKNFPEDDNGGDEPKYPELVIEKNATGASFNMLIDDVERVKINKKYIDPTIDLMTIGSGYSLYNRKDLGNNIYAVGTNGGNWKTKTVKGNLDCQYFVSFIGEHYHVTRVHVEDDYYIFRFITNKDTLNNNVPDITRTVTKDDGTKEERTYTYGENTYYLSIPKLITRANVRTYGVNGIAIKGIIPYTEDKDTTMKIRIAETKAPFGYTRPHFNKMLEVNAKWEEVTKDSEYYYRFSNLQIVNTSIDTLKSYEQDIINVRKFSGNNISTSIGEDEKSAKIVIDIQDPKIPDIDLNLKKVDTNGNGIEDIRFKAEFSQGSLNLGTQNKISAEDGAIDFDVVQPKTTDNIKITLTEKDSGSYILLKDPIEIELKYNGENNTWEKESVTDNNNYEANGVGLKDISVNTASGSTSVNITAVNKENVSLIISKLNQFEEFVSGAKFTIQLTNVTSLKLDGVEKNADGDGSIKIEGYETKNREIKITEIQPKDSAEAINVDLIETSYPDGYLNLGEKLLALTMQKNSSGNWELKERSYNQLPRDYFEISNSESEIYLKIDNIQVINLSGQVWIDGQNGIKNATNPDGKKGETEQKVNGVKVHLYSVKDGKIIATTTTGSNGEYEFIDVIKTAEGYRVYFEYNGLLYNDRGITDVGNEEIDSDAAEIDPEREAFNNRFKTITQGKSNDETVLTYDYNDKKSTLNASTDGSTPTNSSIKAYTTDVYKETTQNIDCGLIEKYFDLALDNLIDKVEYRINGKDWTEDPNPDKVEYDTKSLQKSDYYYRFDDYNSASNDVGFAPGMEDSTTRSNVLGEDTQLNVKAYYNLNIINQSIHEVQEVVIKYTYDNNIYNFIRMGETAGVTCEVISDKEFKIIVSNWDKTKDTIEIPIIFELKNNESLALQMESGLDALTTAEIISYTTKDGALIDNDSEPGNGKEEDDLKQAKLTFKFVQEARKISGNVAEDNNSDGVLDDNKQINDVVVQLIEVIKKDAGTFEYIWQETTSGGSQVKARGKDKKVYTYNVTNEPGQYQFLGHSAEAEDSTGNKKSLNTGFIPGDYIVRFIYGDGTSYDLTDKVATYNGQDYKSTIDMNYQVAEYIPSNYNGKSTARDNEARRLEVMAFSTEIDGKLGVALDTLNKNSFADLNSEEQQLLKDYYKSVYDNSKARLDYAYRAYKNESKNPDCKAPEVPTSNEELYNIIKCYISYETWMCAETSKIEVKNNSQFTEVNFGLAKRPETKLTIEKHITALRIKPTGETGVQPIVDATKGIDDEKAEGVTNGLAIVKSTRTNRGFWKVETDIEELMQGATLEAEYTYVIKNESELDYLGKYLVSQFGTDGYKAELLNRNAEIKNYRPKGDATSNGAFLGTYYYTGVFNDSTDAKVPSIVESLEEALNNQISFASSDHFTAETLNENYNYYNADGELKQITIKKLVRTNSGSDKLLMEDEKDIDSSKKLRLETTLSSSNNGKIGATIPSYIAEITKYSNAAGRKNIAVPENLSYVHSEANELTLDSYVKKDAAENITDIKTEKESGYVQINEADEFWGESIIISKPTGQDKNTPMLITIIAISAVAAIGVGIILIKKFVIRK